MDTYKSKKKHIGASIIETMIVFPIILFMGFAVVHLGLIFQAQSNLEYAALMAARIGASSGLDIAAMTTEIQNRMAPSIVGETVTSTDSVVSVDILNPTQVMFDDCGEQPTFNNANCAVLAACEIPNFGLQSRAAQCDSATIQDANILRIKVNYLFNTGIPFLNRMPFTRGDFPMLAGDGVNIYAVATVRMQTAARRTFQNIGNIN